MDGEDSRYRRQPWTLGGKIGVAVWPVAAFLLLDPMAQWILAPCFFEEGCGAFEGVGLLMVVLAAMLAAVAVSIAVRLGVNLVFGRAPG